MSFLMSKKMCANHILRIALTLSLFNVDSEPYWNQRSHIQNPLSAPINAGSSWELGMLYAVPVEYTYSRCKSVMPLIEASVIFNPQYNNFRNVSAYLFNVHNGQNNQSRESNELQDAAPAHANNSNAPVATANVNRNNTIVNTISPEFDSFNELFQEVPILEQNLANLSDFNDISIASLNVHYSNLLLKDETNNFLHTANEEIENIWPITSSTNFTRCSSPNKSNLSSWSEHNSFTSIEERIGEEHPSNSATFTTKTERETSFRNVDPSKQEIEIAEVLWKQDVDLGYSLPKLQSTIPDTISEKSFHDEFEKLKALEELKHEKIVDDIGNADNNEWNGAYFTIDNETGEYIRLPAHVDELFQDVLPLSEFANNTKDIKSTAPSKCPNRKKTEISERHVDFEDEYITVNPLQSKLGIGSILFPAIDLEDVSSELDEFDTMLQSVSPYYHQQYRSNPSYGNSTSAFRQSSGYQHQRIPSLSRGVSMEQRLQDIASLFSPVAGMGVGMVPEMPPYPHYSPHYQYQGTPGISPQHGQFSQIGHPVLHNTSLSDLSTVPSHYNLGSAVSSSIHLTNSSQECENGSAGYKVEHDMMYYSHTSSEGNHATDGFINLILNEDDLQVMDMHENFCSTRVLDGASQNSSVQQCSGSVPIEGNGCYDRLSMHNSLSPDNGNASETVASNGDRLDTSSDSAVSSMGSERVSSLSDGEWGEGSDSAQDYHEGKYNGPYDYSYNARLSTSNRQNPVAQKKHQMFGRRYFQENATSNASSTASNVLFQPIKNEYRFEDVNNTASLDHNSINTNTVIGSNQNKDQKALTPNATDFKYDAYSFGFPPARPRNALEVVNHNHTYYLPQGSDSSPRPQLRDKNNKKSNYEHMSRDEKRARALNIPIGVNDIINLPMDEFNERLSKFDLSENQLSLIRDIRRRGKNKVAAQNCRKRKLDQIISLEDEVKEVRKRKNQLHMEREMIAKEQKRVSSKFTLLHRHIFQYLRDSEGNLCSPSEYSLQQTTDGSVYLLHQDIKSDSSLPHSIVENSSKTQAHRETSANNRQKD